jgi:hypothetical protein
MSTVSETLAVLDQLQHLVTTSRGYGSGHPATLQSARALALAIDVAAPPVTLQFVVGVAFRSFQVLPLDLERLARVAGLAEALHRSGAQEIELSANPSVEELMLLAEALAAPRGGRSLDDMGLATIRFRELPNAVPGQEIETVEPEIFVAAQIVLGLRALRDVLESPEQLHTRWPFAAGMEAVRRLERAFETNASLTASTLEAAPGPVDVARRALSAAHHVASVCAPRGAPLPTRRALAHATLIVASLGFALRGGRPFNDAAERARQACLGALTPDADPHRLLVASILHDLCGGRVLGAGELVALAYTMELRRCPEDVDFDLALDDLLAAEVSEGRGASRALWTRLRIAVSGSIPPGARVKLKDGRRGIVLGPGPSNDPRRPLLLVEGATEVASSEVAIEAPPSPAPSFPAPEVEEIKPRRRDTRRDSTGPRPADPSLRKRLRDSRRDPTDPRLSQGSPTERDD